MNGHDVKPLDVGNGLTACSVAGDAGLLMVGVPHAGLGYAVLDTAPPFDESRRHDVAAVRRYRLALATDDGGALALRPPGGWVTAEASLDGHAVPRHRLRSGPVAATVVTTTPVGPNGPAACVLQRWRVRHVGGAKARLAWTGRVRLGRAAMTQLTEGGPLPEVAGPQCAVTIDDGFVIERPEVHLTAVVLILGCEARSFVDPAGGRLEAHVTVPPLGGDVVVVVALGVTSAQAVRRAREGAGLDVEQQASDHVARWRRRLSVLPPDVAPPQRSLATRALVYATDCCVAPDGDGACIMTDHRILPLSWTRDGYYVARMLVVVLPEVGVPLVRRHLRWLFGMCDRPHGVFARSYLPNGEVKDAAFQLDQQCYPLLEFADLVERGRDLTLVADLAQDVADLLATIERYRDPSTGLYRTDETPGDDPLDLPYHFSSHVLLWHTMARLAAVPIHGVDAAALRRRADDLHRATLTAFVTDVAGDQGFAYAIDGRGGRMAYHDANDLPTVLAPLWGFCAPDDPVWRWTMAFAFSAANIDGWYPGPYGGLGSVHTRGAWPLGDVQEYIYTRVVGDATGARNVADRLAATACDDGALPEARDPVSGRVRSRHWFAWPGAALTLALMDPAFGA